MKINKYASKAVSAALCLAMALGASAPAIAAELSASGNIAYTENTASDIERAVGESRYENIEVTYSQASSYNVTIPKTVALGADKQSTYSIKVEGDIAANEQVCVAPVDGIADTEAMDFYMYDQTAGSAKGAVPAEINQSKFYWDADEVSASYEEADNHITAEGLTAGSWKGIFQMEISLRTDASHIHNYVGSVTKEPTCTGIGEKTYVCECGDSYTETIPAKGHNYTDGTCTECGGKDPGYHTHAYAAAIAKEPTCTEPGEKTFTCACGDSYTEAVPAKGHTYGADDRCTGCGEMNPIHAHKYTEAIAKEPTCTETGEKTYTCACGDNYTEEMPAKGHNYVDDVCADCGDVNDPYAVAPANAYLDWNHTLNDADNTITLIKYLGKSTDVIVYGSYEIKGKTYQTKIGNWMFASGSTYYMFYDNKTINTVTFSDHIDSSDTTDMHNMFSGCLSLTSIDFGKNFDTSNVMDMRCMFSGCKQLVDLDVSGFNTSNVTNMKEMFMSCMSLTNLDLSGFDTSKVTNMDWMFRGCTSLENIDLSGSNFNQAVSMYAMFYLCDSLKTITLGSARTEDVTAQDRNMQEMFNNCPKLTEIKNLENLNTKNVVNMEAMFANCSSLNELDLSRFDTSKVTNMRYMFSENASLARLNLKGFDTSQVTTMRTMFYKCSSLTELDLGSFNASNVKDMYGMFMDCAKLRAIYVSNGKWAIQSSCNQQYMFMRCGTSSVTYK